MKEEKQTKVEETKVEILKELLTTIASITIGAIAFAWSITILTLNYVTFPNFKQEKMDPTFPASIFTMVLAGFGYQSKNNGASKVNENKKKKSS